MSKTKNKILVVLLVFVMAFTVCFMAACRPPGGGGDCDGNCGENCDCEGGCDCNKTTDCCDGNCGDDCACEGDCDCNGDTPPPPPAGTLSIWTTYPFDATYKETLIANPGNKTAQLTKLIVDEFQKKYPKVTVRMTAKGWSDELNQLIVTNALTNNLPDIISVEAYTRGYAEMGILQPISLNQSLASKMRNAVKADVTYNGEMYGVPLFTGNFAFIANETLLREKDITSSTGKVVIPTTWEEWLGAAKRLKESTPDGSIGGTIFDLESGTGNAFRMLAYMRQAGGDFVNAQGNLVLKSNQNKAAFKFVRDLMQYAPTNATGLTSYADYMSAWTSNRAGYILEHTDIMVNPTHIGNYSAYTMPVPEKGGVYDADGLAGASNVAVGQLTLGITKDCPEDKYNIAKTFIETCLSEQVQLKFFTADGRFPVITQVLESLETSTDPDVAQIATYVRPFLNSLLNDNYAGGLPAFTQKFSDIWNRWDRMISEVVNSTIPIETVVNSAHDDILTLMTSAA